MLPLPFMSERTAELRARLLAAVEVALGGDWEAAHLVAQDHEGDALANWLHAVVHRMEGDLDNARYWYRRAKRAFPGPEAVEHEIAEARRTLAGPAGAPQEKA